MRDPTEVIEIDVRADLEAVESVLRIEAGSDQAFVQEAATYLIEAGGKRFRPMLTLLCGYLGDPKDERLVPCAAAIELTHLATLYHDDVIDETMMRRGVPTANVRYGNSIAVLAGDFLLARASSLASGLGAYVSRRLADTIAALCEGQIMETSSLGRSDVGTEHYLEVIRRKTAALIATACHMGAWLSGAHEDAIAAATAYGDALGMAFQLADDILDVEGDPSASGKIPGTDIREGVMTLPALATLDGRCPRGEDLRVAIDSKDIDAALQILQTNGAIDLARGVVREWQERALMTLEPVPDGDAKAALAHLVGFVSQRSA